MITGFITTCDKKTSPTLFGPFWKTLLPSVANKEFSRISKYLLQVVTGITKWENYKSVTGITN